MKNPFKTKRKVGMEQRPRERAQVDRDYQSNAMQAGHKARLIIEHESEVERLHREVQEHLVTMRKLDLEFQQTAAPKAEPLPDVAPQAAETPAPEITQ